MAMFAKVEPIEPPIRRSDVVGKLSHILAEYESLRLKAHQLMQTAPDVFAQEAFLRLWQGAAGQQAEVEEKLRLYGESFVTRKDASLSDSETPADFNRCLVEYRNTLSGTAQLLDECSKMRLPMDITLLCRRHGMLVREYLHRIASMRLIRTAVASPGCYEGD